MGTPKHVLQFGDETALQRVVRIVRRVVAPVVVVAAPGQPLPTLSSEVLIAHDEQPGLGPLTGLVTGLKVLAQEVDAVYLTGCDAPLLRSEFVREMISRWQPEDDILVPEEAGQQQPLAAVYSVDVLPLAQQRLAENQLSLRGLIGACRARSVQAETLRDVDSDLRSLWNMNSPADYQQLRKIVEDEKDAGTR